MSEPRQWTAQEMEDGKLIADTFQRLVRSMLAKGFDREMVVTGMLGAAIRELNALQGGGAVVQWLRVIAATLEAQNKPPESVN